MTKSLSGTHFHYLEICTRKLWLYDKGLGMESQSDRVKEGKVLHERSYQHLKKKDIQFDDQFAVDAIDGDYVREVKISSKMQHADKLQLLFYLDELAERGIYKKGLLSYRNERKTVEVTLDAANKEQLKIAKEKAIEILSKSTPPKLKHLPYCTKCAYVDFCFIGEEEEWNHTTFFQTAD